MACHTMQFAIYTIGRCLLGRTNNTRLLVLPEDSDPYLSNVGPWYTAGPPPSSASSKRAPASGTAQHIMTSPFAAAAALTSASPPLLPASYPARPLNSRAVHEPHCPARHLKGRLMPTHSAAFSRLPRCVLSHRNCFPERASVTRMK